LNRLGRQPLSESIRSCACKITSPDNSQNRKHTGTTAPFSNHRGWGSRACWTNSRSVFFSSRLTYVWQTVEVCIITFTFLVSYTSPIGYPPADFPVCDFLRANGARLPRGEANTRIRCFLVALFNEAEKVLRTCMGSSKTEQILTFREFMSRNQTMKSPGSNRLSFFQNVVGRATEVRCGLFD
jgi:hypothetical protein